MRLFAGGDGGDLMSVLILELNWVRSTGPGFPSLSILKPAHLDVSSFPLFFFFLFPTEEISLKNPRLNQSRKILAKKIILIKQSRKKK